MLVLYHKLRNSIVVGVGHAMLITRCWTVGVGHAVLITRCWTVGVGHAVLILLGVGQWGWDMQC